MDALDMSNRGSGNSSSKHGADTELTAPSEPATVRRWHLTTMIY